jgi:hypothetical protein
MSMLWRLVQTLRPQRYESRQLLDFRTDHSEFVPQGVLSCFDAALVHITACTLGQLGILALPPTAGYGLDFARLVERLASSTGVGKLFTLCRPKHISCVAHVFQETTGCFMVHCLHYHVEDMGVHGTQSIAHYIVYNADTRVLFLYPEVRLGLACMMHVVLGICDAQPTMEHARRCWSSKSAISPTLRPSSRNFSTRHTSFASTRGAPRWPRSGRGSCVSTQWPRHGNCHTTHQSTCHSSPTPPPTPPQGAHAMTFSPGGFRCV